MYTLSKSTRVCRVHHHNYLLTKNPKPRRGKWGKKALPRGIIVLMHTHYFTHDSVTLLNIWIKSNLFVASHEIYKDTVYNNMSFVLYTSWTEQVCKASEKRDPQQVCAAAVLLARAQCHGCHQGGQQRSQQTLTNSECKYSVTIVGFECSVWFISPWST